MEIFMELNNKNILSRRLRELRLLYNLNQKEVAEELHLTSQAVSNYEHGKREPKIAELVRIADYYKVSIDYLVGRVDNQ